ncbi:BTB/POZ domain-containing protein 9 [Pteropus alecto]|uniref:BTB/POZ domain-containing protein 9 n=1 Tax=Pteropus alecto TaxID=9402 RepID=L5L0I6_PTEAL|nr:BTB/POZ domain-containing protein 9 [Pteropus alecto]
MLKTCPVKLCTVRRCQNGVARRKAAEVSGSPLQISSFGQEKASQQSSGGLGYIRIVGTHNTVNKIFHIVAFECMFTNKTFTLEKGLIVPMENVATIADCASVIEGVSRSRNALLNGDTKNYDWDSGYTCHQLGSGAIVVQLAQPYMIGSIRHLPQCYHKFDSIMPLPKRIHGYYLPLGKSSDEGT